MTTDAAEIRAQLATLARDQLGWTKPLPEGDLAEGLDSVDRLALVVAIEDHYQIAFEPEDDEAAATLDDVVRIVLERLAAKP
jgi:acyl carrier protein